MIADSISEIVFLRSWSYMGRIAARRIITPVCRMHIWGKRLVVTQFPCYTMGTDTLVVYIHPPVGIALRSFPWPATVDALHSMGADLDFTPKGCTCLFVAPRVMTSRRAESSRLASVVPHLKRRLTVRTDNQSPSRLTSGVFTGVRTVHPSLYTARFSGEQLSAPVTGQRYFGPFHAGPASVRTKPRRVFAIGMDFKVRITESAKHENSGGIDAWHRLNLHELRAIPQGICARATSVDAGLSGCRSLALHRSKSIARKAQKSLEKQYCAAGQALFLTMGALEVTPATAQRGQYSTQGLCVFMR